jgi:hypothetical protein
LKRGYITSDDALAVHRYVEHQLGYESSVEMWRSYAGFVVDGVEKMGKQALNDLVPSGHVPADKK